MARRNRPNPREERILRRVSSTRVVKKSFLIICEGENTEPDYFNAFRLTSANIKAVGQGINTIGLVQKAITIKEEERRKGNTFDQYWVVFDKDDFPNNDFNNAISLAQQNGFMVAYSNQAFELWFLLHFNLIQGPLHRNQYLPKLNNNLTFQYSKDRGIGSKMYNELQSKQGEAIKNANIILQQMQDVSPALAESSTTVHLLVEELNKYL